jgi:serine/threonine-protein kinase
MGNEEPRRNPTCEELGLRRTELPPERPVSSPLSPDQWQQLESLVDALLDTPPERRAALLAEVTGGDPDRRAELERLVAECERAYPLLDRPAIERFGDLAAAPILRESQVVAGRYRVTRELARGGMASVYLARDLKHDRDVAVKVVRGELAAALGSGRFLREIRIAAHLRHPHIVPLYDSGDADGLLYYVMPYESGQSLRARLRKEGQLPIDDAVAILRDVCDALAHAHEHGVVHRDIKPDNVLLTGRHALVTDFGVAKALTPTEDAANQSDPQSGITAAGVMLGTPAYMAPEQASADPRIDHRADIYAVGVLGYEMLAGHPPFRGDTTPEMLAAQLSSAPEPLSVHRPDVPPSLGALIMKCLVKRPDDRWQRADDLVHRLEHLDDPTPPAATGEARRPRRTFPRHRSVAYALSLAAVGAAAWTLWPEPHSPPALSSPAPPALAVLVFQHGPPEDLEPLAVAVTANLIAALGDVPRLNVRSLRAVWPYRDPGIPLDSVARRLDVPWVVGGHVHRAGSQNVVTVDLTDAATGRRLAGSRAVAAAGNDLELIDDLVTKVAGLLRERIGDHVRVERWRAGTRSSAALASVSRAYGDIRDADALLENDLSGARLRLRRADSTLERASRADPSWSEPHVERAWIARTLALAFGPEGLVVDSLPVTLGRGVAHAQTALRLQPGDPRALEAHGVLLQEMSMFAPKDSASRLRETAERLLTRATDADSTLARALNTLSSIHFSRGELDRARVMAAKAHVADAYSEDAKQVLARLFVIDFDAANDTSARGWCTTYARQFPRDWFPGYCRLMLMGWDDNEPPNPAEAWKIARAATADAPAVIRSPVGAQLQTLVAGVLARLGPAGGAERVLDEVHATIAADSSVAREPFGSELLQLEAGVRVRLDQSAVAANLLRAYLERTPASAARVARGRRFRELSLEQLRDTTAAR